jgi:hypothetical protein
VWPAPVRRATAPAGPELAPERAPVTVATT